MHGKASRQQQYFSLKKTYNDTLELFLRHEKQSTSSELMGDTDVIHRDKVIMALKHHFHSNLVIWPPQHQKRLY